MGIFDSRAKEWDKPDRIKLASAISMCMTGILNPDKKMTAIDIGAGTGLVTIELAKLVNSVVALDSSEGMLAVLREKIQSNNIENIKTGIFDAEKDSPAEEPADIVVSSMSMHHVKDTSVFALKVYKMLKPGGRMAIADLEKEDGSFHGENPGGVMHYGFDRAGLEKDFKDAGFKNIRFSTAYKIPKEKMEYPVFLMIGEK